MPFGVLFVITASLAGPVHADQSRAVPRAAATRPHTFGIGGSVMASTSGVGGAFRYWFGDRVGVDFGAAWSRPRITAEGRASITHVTPSVIVMLRPSRPGADVEIRPFVGAGLTWVSSAAPLSSRSRVTTSTRSRTGGTGGQAFGGIEMVFADAPSLAISAQAVYSALPSGVYSVNTIDGFNVVLAVHYYIR